MKITKEEYESIKDFIKKFREYHDVANGVFAVTKGREYMPDADFKKLKEDERHMRDYLNEEFGNLEETIYSLLGGRPFMRVPNMPGSRWDTFSEALSGNFTIVKGETLNQADDYLVKVGGLAKRAMNAKDKIVEYSGPQTSPSKWFSDDLLQKITDAKVNALCVELNNVSELNPNATALLMRTILLLTLQKKLGKASKEDLKDVLNQAISQDSYKDVHIKRILTNLSSIPKTLLDASHHSKWIIVKKDDLGIWLPGLVNVVEATFR